MRTDPSPTTVAPEALDSLCARAARCGLDARALWTWPAPGGERIPLERMMVLRRRLAETAQDPDLGMRLASVLCLDDFGLMGARARVGTDLGDALEAIARFLPLWQQGAQLSLERHSDRTRVVWHPPVGLDPVGTFVDAQETVLGIVRVPELLDGDPGHDITVQMPRTLLGPEPTWLRAVTLVEGPGWWVAFPNERVHRPRLTSEPVRVALQHAAAAALGHLPADDPLARRLAHLLATRPMALSLEQAASHLARSPRSLQRDLGAHGTSFRAVRERHARAIAEALLVGTDQSLDTIACHVGLSTTPAFVRAFKRWTGQSPGQWRAHARRSA